MNILSLSGGKDSTALAIYCKDIIDLLVFCDTGIELPETYEYIKKVSKYINKPLKIISNHNFKFWLDKWNGFLPSFKSRWCTRTLKIIPFEAFLAENHGSKILVGLRADEEKRKGHLGIYKANYIYPFKDDNMIKSDIDNILKEFEIPEFYKWKSRSGCFACPFLRKKEWEGLYKYHNTLFEWAKSL